MERWSITKMDEELIVGACDREECVIDGREIDSCFLICEFAQYLVWMRD